MCDNWITDRYPEPFKEVLLYDLMRGINIGFYDMISGRFFISGNVPIDMVAGWMKLPLKPEALSTIRDNINSISCNAKVVCKGVENDASTTPPKRWGTSATLC